MSRHSSGNGKLLDLRPGSWTFDAHGKLWSIRTLSELFRRAAATVPFGYRRQLLKSRASFWNDVIKLASSMTSLATANALRRASVVCGGRANSISTQRSGERHVSSGRRRGGYNHNFSLTAITPLN